jgi:hypothetical protein
MNHLSKRTWLEIIGGLVAATIIGVLLIMWANPRTEVLDTKQFTSYDDCVKNGGVTGHTDISACIGSNDQLFLQYSAQNLPRLSERKANTTPNTVVAEGDYSADLVAFLKQDYTGCKPTGYYKVLKEVKNRFALMDYGCDSAGQSHEGDAKIIAIKLADGWVLISPTNNMRGATPSCLLVDMFKVSKKLSAQCFESTGYNDGTLRNVSYE